MYNNLHVILTRRKLEPQFVSIKSMRFSGTNKLIVGVSSISTIVQEFETITLIWCYFKSEKRGDVLDVARQVVAVLLNLPQTLVAVVAVIVFYGFVMLMYFKFYLSCCCQGSCALSRAKDELSHQQDNLERGVDRRNIFQRAGSMVSNRYSKDAVNQRNVQSAHGKVSVLRSAVGGKQCFGMEIPDLGSNAGTCGYNFWALIWESL